MRRRESSETDKEQEAKRILKQREGAAVEGRVTVKGKRLQRIPPIEMLKENNARRGFFEREQFDAVRRHLPEDLRNLVTVAYVTGWRIADELYRSSGVRSISRPARCAWNPGTTKNDEGRTQSSVMRAYTKLRRSSRGSMQGKVLGKVGKNPLRPEV